jgi:hypothetical protein
MTVEALVAFDEAMHVHLREPEQLALPEADQRQAVLDCARHDHDEPQGCSHDPTHARGARAPPLFAPDAQTLGSLSDALERAVETREEVAPDRVHVRELRADIPNRVETMARVEAQQERADHERDTGMAYGWIWCWVSTAIGMGLSLRTRVHGSFGVIIHMPARCRCRSRRWR